MSSFPRKKSSPARERLAETVAARQSTESKLANVRASLARLADHEASVTAAEQKLAALNAAEADATLKWAKSGKGDAPAVNADRREEISKALAAARAQAAAAAAARASLEAEASAASANLPGIEKWSKAAIAQIVAEEAEPLIAELTESMRAIAGKQERLKQMFAFVVGAAEFTATAKRGSPTGLCRGRAVVASNAESVLHAGKPARYGRRIRRCVARIHRRPGL